MAQRIPLPSLHRSLGVVAGALLLYLGVSGAAVQVVDLAAIVRNAPATDPDRIAIRESLDGPGNYAVIAPGDYAAPVLPADLPIAATIGRIAQGTAPANWVELRMEQGRPVARAMVSGHVQRFDAIDGHPLPALPEVQYPKSSNHQVAKRWHRLWALGDGLLWIDALAGLATATLVVLGLALWWRLYRARLRMGRRQLTWAGGGTVREWHRTMALVAALPLLVVSLSGAVLSVDSLSLAVYRWRHPDRLMFGMVPVGMVADYSQPMQPDAVADMARRTMAAWHGDTPRVVRVRMFAGMPQGVVITGEPEARQVVLDTRSGQPVSMHEPGYPDTVFPTGWEWHERLKRIHRGDAFGPIGRWIGLAAGLSLAWFAGSGLWIYFQLWQRRRKSGRGAPFWK
jgi:uncharacterized iron-regulated membrane protein